MTIEQAILQLESLKCDRESFFNNDGDDDVFRADAEACEIGIEALEKQIPKKPILSDEQAVRYAMQYTCPSCGRDFSGTGIADYCYHCGQALDWSNENA